MGLDDNRVVTLDFDHGTLHWAFYKLASCSRHGSLQPIPNRHHTGCHARLVVSLLFEVGSKPVKITPGNHLLLQAQFVVSLDISCCYL